MRFRPSRGRVFRPEQWMPRYSHAHDRQRALLAMLTAAGVAIYTLLQGSVWIVQGLIPVWWSIGIAAVIISSGVIVWLARNKQLLLASNALLVLSWGLITFLAFRHGVLSMSAATLTIPIVLAGLLRGAVGSLVMAALGYITVYWMGQSQLSAAWELSAVQVLQIEDNVRSLGALFFTLALIISLGVRHN